MMEETTENKFRNYMLTVSKINPERYIQYMSAMSDYRPYEVKCQDDVDKIFENLMIKVKNQCIKKKTAIDYRSALNKYLKFIIQV